MYEDKELYINEIRPDVYLLDEAHEATGFVIIGQDELPTTDCVGWGFCYAAKWHEPAGSI